MSSFAARVGTEQFRFSDLKAVMACASPRRSGGELAGLAADSDRRRVAARRVLAGLPLATFLNEALVPYENDAITRLILDGHDPVAFRPVAGLTVGEFRDWLLSPAAHAAGLAALGPGLIPEMAAAVSKLMRNQDLIAVAAKIRVVTGFRSTLGLEGRLSARLQPNHPTDDPAGIMAATLDGLLYGMGDAVIGINPASDSVASCGELLRMLDALRRKAAIPTQTCVLSHVTTSLAAMEAGAPLDLVFQSIGGTEAANAAFGVTLDLLEEARQAALSLVCLRQPRQ